MKPTPVDEEDPIADEEPVRTMQELADRATGLTPLHFIATLAESGRLPRRLDALLIVIPATWGAKN